MKSKVGKSLRDIEKMLSLKYNEFIKYTIMLSVKMKLVKRHMKTLMGRLIT